MYASPEELVARFLRIAETCMNDLIGRYDLSNHDCTDHACNVLSYPVPIPDLRMVSLVALEGCGRGVLARSEGK